MRIVIAKESFNRKISLLRSKLNIELSNKLVRCYVWSIILYDSETWALKKTGAEVFVENLNVVLEEIKEDKMVKQSN